MVYPAWVSLFFFLEIFSESSEPIGLKFGHNAWIGPEGDNKELHRDSFCSFLIKNQKLSQMGFLIVTVATGPAARPRDVIMQAANGRCLIRRTAVLISQQLIYFKPDFDQLFLICSVVVVIRLLAYDSKQ